MADVRTLSNLLDRWLTIIAKKPLATLMVLIAITVVVAARLPGIHFSASLHDLIVDGSPERQHYDRFKTLFGNDAIVQVVVKGNDFFSVHDFERLGRGV